MGDKICNNCGNIKNNEKGLCKICYNTRQREYRLKNSNKNTIKYEKTIKGFLVRLYRNMQSRIDGVQKRKHYLYKGKELLSREDFYSWALNNKKFMY